MGRAPPRSRSFVLWISVALAQVSLPACADPFIESTTILGDTADTNGPYQVSVVAVGINSSDRLELFYQSPVSEGIVILRAVSDDGDDPGELHLGGIPGQPAGTEVTYRVTIERGGLTVASDPPEGPEGDGGFVFVVTP